MEKGPSASKKKKKNSLTFFFSNPRSSLNFDFHLSYPHIFWKPSLRRTLSARLPTFLLIFWKFWPKIFFLTHAVSYICALFLVRFWVWVNTCRVKVVANFISNNFYDTCLDSKCLSSDEKPKNRARTRWPPHPHHMPPPTTRPDPPSPVRLLRLIYVRMGSGWIPPHSYSPNFPTSYPNPLGCQGLTSFKNSPKRERFSSLGGSRWAGRQIFWE